MQTLSGLEPLLVKLVEDRKIAPIGLMAKRTIRQRSTPVVGLNGSRSEKLFTRLDDALNREMLHAAVSGVCAGRLKIAAARLIGLKDRTEVVQLELVLVKDIVEEDNLLAEADRDVHRHRHTGDDEIALVDKSYELLEREVTEVLGFRRTSQLLILPILLLASEKDNFVSFLLESASEGHPVLVLP